MGTDEGRQVGGGVLDELVDAYRIIIEATQEEPPRPLITLGEAKEMLRTCKSRRDMVEYAWRHCKAVM